MAVTWVMGTAALELVVREAFHRLSIDIPPLFHLAIAWLAVMTLSAVAWLPISAYVEIAAPRCAFAMAGLLSISMMWTGHLFPLPTLAGWGVRSLVLALGLALAWVGLARLRQSAWARVRLSVCVACGLFVCSQSILGAMFSPRHVAWPAWPKPTALASGLSHRKSAQIFLLLDELGADSAQPVIEALRQQGLAVRFKAVDPAGPGTIQVVPAMFGGGNFETARPCGITSVCGRATALDFSHIDVSRDDVDIVGFFFPYCAIRGLRFCERATIDPRFFDGGWWVCEASGLVAKGGRPFGQACDSWIALAGRVEAGIWRAPIWERGGFLYAHIPLPHPPAEGLTLDEDYASNVRRAADLVRRMVIRAHDAHIDDVTFVVFADHPLRRLYWCSQPQYSSLPCDTATSDLGHKVPIIVAGRTELDVESLTSNIQVFSLQPR